PLLLAGLLVVRNHVAWSRILLQVRDGILHADGDDQIVPEYRAVGMAPPDRVAAVVLLEIAEPELFAGEIVGRQVAVAEVADDDLAVGHRGGAGHVLNRVEDLLAPAIALAWHRRGANLARPLDLSRAEIDFEKLQLLAFLSGEKRDIAPDGRR